MAVAFADVNGQRLAYEDSGGSGPAVLFSHGVLMDRTMFDAQVDALAPDYRCIRWDARGHGASARPAAPFPYWDAADDAIGILDHLGVDRAVLVGMSQGGFTSLRAALRHPRRVVALGLIDTQAGGEDQAVMVGYMAAAEIVDAHGFIDDVANFAAAVILGSDAAVNAHWIARWRADRPGPARLLMEVLGAREDITPRLGEIGCPAVVIHGTADAAIPIELAETLAAGLPRCDGLVRVQDAGHASNVTHPAAVNEALRAFLARHAATPAAP
jgi:3-oxoadipate enol-lactonase